MAIIQAVSNTANSSTTVAVNITATPGNALVLIADNDQGGTVSGVTGGGTWAIAKQQIWNFSTHSTEIWYLPNNAGGALTVTVTFTVPGWNSLIVAEYPAADIIASSPLDKTASAQSGDGVSSSPADSGNTAATAQDNELLIGGIGTFDTYAQITPTNSFSAQANVRQPVAAVTLVLQDRVVTAAGAYKSTDALSPTTQWAALIATFKSDPLALIGPTPQTVSIGGSPTFSVAASGAAGGPYTYQWQADAGGDFIGVDIGGETASSYSPGAVTYQDRGKHFRVKVTGGGATVYTQWAALDVLQNYVAWIPADVYLYEVPSDADPDDVRLRDPTTFTSVGPQAIAATGIASAEAFGTGKLNFTLFATSIASAEAFGTAKVNPSVTISGIASAEAFGTAQLNFRLFPAGIASSEAFGTLRLGLKLTPFGITSAEAFGTAQLNLRILLTGIASAEAFGAHTVSVAAGALTITPAGIASAEAFGALTVALAVISPPAQQNTSGGSIGAIYIGERDLERAEREIERVTKRFIPEPPAREVEIPQPVPVIAKAPPGPIATPPLPNLEPAEDLAEKLRFQVDELLDRVREDARRQVLDGQVELDGERSARRASAAQSVASEEAITRRRAKAEETAAREREEQEVFKAILLAAVILADED